MEEKKKSPKMGIIKGGKSISGGKEQNAGEQENASRQDEQKQQKLTYEQLNDACQQLFQQNQQLLRQLKEQNMVNMFKRLDYLFKVVEFADTFKDADFVNGCLDEIKGAMTIDDKESKE